MMLQSAQPRFPEATVKRVREALKEFHRSMKKIGIHPRYEATSEEIIIIIPLDDIIRIIRNRVESAVKGYVHTSVRHEGGYMVVKFRP